MNRSRRQFRQISGSLPFLGIAGVFADGDIPNSVGGEVVSPAEKEPIFIGDDRQLFMDDYLIGRSENVRLRCMSRSAARKSFFGTNRGRGTVVHTVQFSTIPKINVT